MGIGNGIKDLFKNYRDLLQRQGASPFLDKMSKSFARDIFHDDEVTAFMFNKVIEGHHIGVVKPVHHLCFTKETFVKGKVALKRGREHLDGHCTTGKGLVLTQIYHCHATLAYYVYDFIIAYFLANHDTSPL